MNLRMKFVVATIALGCAQSVYANSNTSKSPQKGSSNEVTVAGLATCASFVNLAQNYKLSVSTPQKAQAANMFFMQEAEKKVDFEEYAMASLNHTSTYTQLYSNSIDTNILTHSLVKEKIRSEAESCIKYYEAKIR